MQSIRLYILLILPILFFGCSLFIPKKQKIVTPFDGRSYLECASEIEFVSSIPKSVVYLKSDETQEIIGTCSNCREISKEEYHEFFIPEDALSACGGWWAGSSDYYYLYCNEGTIELFATSYLSKEKDNSSISWELIGSWEI